MATQGLLKTTVFWNKGYDVINPVRDVTRDLSRDSNYIVDVVMCPKFDNSRFLWEKSSQPQFYKDLTRKTAVFEGLSLGSSSIIWDWH